MTDPVRDESWRDDALCQQVGGELFFPPKGGDNGCAARQVCARCPVQADCLEYAVTTFQRHGIWGGKGEHEFRKVRAERGLVEPAGETPAGSSVTAEEARHLLACGLSTSTVARRLGKSEGWIRQLLGGGKRAAA